MLLNREFLYFLSSVVTKTVAILLLLLTLNPNLELFYSVLVNLTSLENNSCVMACCINKSAKTSCCCKNPQVIDKVANKDAENNVNSLTSDHCKVDKKVDKKNSQESEQVLVNNETNVLNTQINTLNISQNSKNHTHSFTNSPNNKVIRIGELSKPCPCSLPLAPLYLRALNTTATLAQAINPPPIKTVLYLNLYNRLLSFNHYLNLSLLRAPPYANLVCKAQ